MQREIFDWLEGPLIFNINFENISRLIVVLRNSNWSMKLVIVIPIINQVFFLYTIFEDLKDDYWISFTIPKAFFRDSCLVISLHWKVKVSILLRDFNVVVMNFAIICLFIKPVVWVSLIISINTNLETSCASHKIFVFNKENTKIVWGCWVDVKRNLCNVFWCPIWVLKVPVFWIFCKPPRITHHS